MAHQKLLNLSAAPASPAAGWMYFDTTLYAIGVYTGTAWVYGSGTTWGTGGAGYTEIDGNLTLGGKAVSAVPPSTGLPLLAYNGTDWIAELVTLHDIAVANANDGDVTLNSHKLTNVADATAATDGLNRESGDARYVFQPGTPSQPSRVVGTAYTPSTTRPTMVYLTIRATALAVSPAIASAQVDVNGTAFIVGDMTAVNQSIPVAILVPANQTYEVTSSFGTVTIDLTTEQPL